MCDNEVMEI